MKNNTKESTINKIPIAVYENKTVASQYVAQRIATLIKQKQEAGQKAVLGLATGNTPILLYKELIRMHQYEGLSFKNVVTFNLDEYFPMHPTNSKSYVTFMHHNLFNHIDIPKEQIHIPDGRLAVNDIDNFCQKYEQQIASFGGLDLQVLGIGLTGHIGFNEPGATSYSTTRLVALNSLTREVAIPDFDTLENVPSQAITMGVRTITQAKEIMLLAWSKKKASIIQQAVQQDITPNVPASYLQQHPQVKFVLDTEAASLL